MDGTPGLALTWSLPREPPFWPVQVRGGAEGLVMDPSLMTQIYLVLSDLSCTLRFILCSAAKYIVYNVNGISVFALTFLSLTFLTDLI